MDDDADRKELLNLLNKINKDASKENIKNFIEKYQQASEAVQAKYEKVYIDLAKKLKELNANT